MSKDQKNHNIRSFKELLILAAVFVVILVLSYFFDVFYFIIEFVNNHPHSLVYIDEVFMGLLTLAVGFAVFSWRRWVELKKETAQRIKLQEELLNQEIIKNQTERIINKQLHVEIEERKRLK